MSRKGNKGFHRLENHELTDFTSLQRGSDSGSEIELDLRAPSIRDEGRYDGGGRNSLCCWLLGLYLAILTILIVLMAMCTAYVALNYMHSQRDMLEAHDQLSQRIDALQSSMDKASSTWAKQLSTAMVMISLNNASVTQELGRLGDELSELELRTAKIESKPEGKLIKKLEQKMAALNLSMGVLNRNTALLNRSLGDVQEIKTRMASLKSVLDSYDARLNEVHRSLGDLTHKDTQLEGRVDPLSSDVAVVKGSLQGVQDAVSKSHETFDQSIDLLTSQFQNLQVIMSALNHSTTVGVEELRGDISKQRHRVESLSVNLTVVMGEVDSVTSQVEDILVLVNSEPTASQPTSPTSAGNVAQPTTMMSVLNQTDHTDSHLGGLTDEGTTTKPSTTAPPQNQSVSPTPTSSTTGDGGVTSSSPPTNPQTDQPSAVPTEVTKLPTSNSSTNGDTQNPTEEAGGSGSGGSSLSTGATEDVPNVSEDGGGGGGGGGGEKTVVGSNSSTSVSSSTPPPPESTSATEDNPNKEVNKTVSSTTDSLSNGSPAVGNDTTVTNLTAPTSSTATPPRTNGTDSVSPGQGPSDAPTAQGELDNDNLRKGISALEGLVQDFDQYDLDKDGLLNRNEFSVKFPNAQELFNSLDTNGDSNLSMQELTNTLAFLRGQLSKDTEPDIGTESAS